MIIALMELVRALIQHARSLIYELVKRDQQRLSRTCAFESSLLKKGMKTRAEKNIHHYLSLFRGSPDMIEIC